MISAFLVAHQCFKLLKKENKRYLSASDIIHVYCRKWLRLAPLYYLILFIGWTSTCRMTNGPIWSMMNDNWYDCYQTWWHKILFVGNLTGFVGPFQGCYYWTWSIECDMQLTLLVPLFVQIFRIR